MATEYLDHHAKAHSVKHWDPNVLNNKLRPFGFGLLLVSSPTFVSGIIDPTDRSPSREKLQETIDLLARRQELVG
ncbi:MAG: hypothetical protein ABI548_25735 [Polyangiaceae bacterium]